MLRGDPVAITLANATSDAIAAQWFVPDEYSWQREITVRNKDDWSNFNPEAQAAFLQDIWILGELRDPNGATVESGNGAFYDAEWEKRLGYFQSDDYTGIARRAVRTVRDEWF